jgi:putative membrane protein
MSEEGHNARAYITTGRRRLLAAFAFVSIALLVVVGDGRSNSATDVIRTCLLLIVIPLSILAAVPSALLVRAGGRWGLRWVDSPLVAPLLTPVVLGLYFFTPTWVAVLSHTWLYVLSYPLLLLVGFILHIGLKGSGRIHSSTSLGLQILLSLVDLMFDAIPGIVMRLSHHVIGAGFWSRPPSTISSAMHHQLLAGAILWFLAEVSDLPILAMVFVRWIRVDEAEARRIDAMLDAREQQTPG